MNIHKCFSVSGTTTVGERGQVVIPADIRGAMKLKVGEKLLVFSKHDRFIGLIRATDVDVMLEKMTQHFTQGVQHIREAIQKKS